MATKSSATKKQQQYIIGVDLGGTNIVVGAMSADGKHHCAMVTEAGSESGPAVHSSPCLSFSGARAVPASPNLGVLATPPASAVSLPKNSANQLVNEAPMRGLFHAPRQLRGPPYLFFS